MNDEQSPLGGASSAFKDESGFDSESDRDNEGNSMIDEEDEAEVEKSDEAEEKNEEKPEEAKPEEDNDQSRAAEVSNMLD